MYGNAFLSDFSEDLVNKKIRGIFKYLIDNHSVFIILCNTEDTNKGSD